MTSREKKKQLQRQQIKKHHKAVLQQQNNLDFIDVDLDELTIDDFIDEDDEENKYEIDH